MALKSKLSSCLTTGEAGLPDAALDQASLAVDHLHLHQPGEELHVIQALGRALARMARRSG